MINSPFEALEGQPVYSVDIVRDIEQWLINEYRVSGLRLMLKAGRAAFQRLRDRWPDRNHVVVLCGSGNNGGDGWVVAWLAREAGLQVCVVCLEDPARVKGDALAARSQYVALPDAHIVTSLVEAEALLTRAGASTVLVDGLLGTGFSGALRPHQKTLLDLVNKSRADRSLKTMALDVPSGLCAQTGRLAEMVFKADVTVTFIGLKKGLLTGAARECCGDVYLELLHDQPLPAPWDRGLGQVLSAQHLRRRVATRPRHAHKGYFGHVLVLGGAPGMGGAAILAAEAALRSGAGWVSVGLHESFVGAAIARRPELMAFSAIDVEQLEKSIARADVIAIGPGLGMSAWGEPIWHAAIASGKPMVVDADGLNWLAQNPVRLPSKSILTPHPGEASRLLQDTTLNVEGDRFAAVNRLAERYGCTVILKGAGTLISSAETSATEVCLRGNPGMAVAGMGDVLSGVVAAWYAQGQGPHDAATIGVYLHATAADTAVLTCGEHGLLPSDVIDAIPQTTSSFISGLLA